MIRHRRWYRFPAILAFATATPVLSACGITTQQEIQLGQQYAAEINRQLPMVNDAVVNQYINYLGRSIAQHGNRQFGYTFHVVNARQVNAFAIPGGHVYVNRGLIEQTHDMSELAGVLAHEIAHVEHRHGVAQMERMQNLGLAATLGYVLLGRAPTGIEEAAINVGGTLYFASHSREAENEADATAVRLLTAAGISPQGLPTFFNTLLSERRRSPSTVEQWFSTHPLTEDRIANTQAYINRLPAYARDGRRNDSSYEDMKARLRNYRPAPS